MSGNHKTNRRNANEAIRRLIQVIDMDRKDVAWELYYCKKCEVPMGPLDIKQLGLDPDEYNGRKRLHRIVIDGKVIALLKDGAESTDQHDILRGVTGLDSKVVSNRPM